MPTIEPYAAKSVWDPPMYSQAVKVSGAQTILYIAGQVAYFAARGEQFEWKLYHSLYLGSRPCRGAHGGIAHGAWPAGNGAAMPWAKCPCRPGAGPTGDGSRTIQYRSATAPVQA